MNFRTVVKVVAVVFGLVVASYVTLSNAKAAELPKEPIANVSSEEIFPNLKDTDKVVVMPDGGVLHGEATISEGTETITVNSETSSEAIPLKEYRDWTKKKAQEPKPVDLYQGPMLMGDKYSLTHWFLEPGADYLSNEFTGKGWIYAGYIFWPKAGTGGYLRWQTIVDSGRVGSQGDAMELYLSGTLGGTAIYPGEVRYFTSPTTCTTYYTYNPLAKTRYYVGNY